MITLIGTGHVFDLSSAVTEIFDEKLPDIICVELDRQRYNALLIKNTNPKKYLKARKNIPFIYKILARFQDNMAKEYGVNAGDEMLTAIKYAHSHQIPLEFIDMNAQKLFSNMLKSMSLSEKIKLLLSGVSGLFVSKKRVESELKKIEKEFDNYIEQIANKFPTIKKTLIDERNEYMSKKLMKLTEEKQQIVACVGDGHISGISKLLDQNNIHHKIIRLRELRNRKVESDATTASFTMEYKKP
jgi:pheromone shutdown-related protein TraB